MIAENCFSLSTALRSRRISSELGISSLPLTWRGGSLSGHLVRVVYTSTSEYSTRKVVRTQQTTVTSCPGGGGGGGGGGAGGGGGGGGGGGDQETLTYATAVNAVEEVEVEVDEVKMEAEDHLAREYVQEFVLDHLDPADVKREVSAISHFGNVHSENDLKKRNFLASAKVAYVSQCVFVLQAKLYCFFN